MGFVKPITGRGITTSVGMEAADLGIPRWDAKRGCNIVVFGDNFTEWGMRGEWQSPSIICYDDDYNVLGIPTATGIASEGMRRQLWPYAHANAEYSTILPCDIIKVAGMWYVACMVTAGLGNELRTVIWQSRNLVDWAKTSPYVALNHPGHRGNTMLTFDQIGDWVYIFGTAGLARDEAVFMWRVGADHFPALPWSPWGFDGQQWGWGIPNDNSPILLGRHGELCFRYLQGNCVLSFFDVDNYSQAAITVPHPTDDWTAANRIDYAHGDSLPQLYGGYITPASQLNQAEGMGFLVSQWNTQSNDPYHVVLVTDTLTAQGPLLVTPPTAEPPPPDIDMAAPPPLADIPKDQPMTPQELLELLTRELSASGSKPIPTPEGGTVTLREAVEAIHWKERGLHGLTGRPRHPNQPDDQLGHVLSLRADVSMILTCVVALADKAGIDTAALYAQVQKAIK